MSDICQIFSLQTLFKKKKLIQRIFLKSKIILILKFKAKVKIKILKFMAEFIKDFFFLSKITISSESVLYFGPSLYIAL